MVEVFLAGVFLTGVFLAGEGLPLRLELGVSEVRDLACLVRWHWARGVRWVACPIWGDA